jgi:hypothetical protein
MTLKKSTIKIFSILFMLNLISTTISCSKEEKNNTNSIVPTVPTVELGGSLGTRTLYKDTIYVLDRFAYVDNGNVLTIQAGTIIKAKTGDGMVVLMPQIIQVHFLIFLSDLQELNYCQMKKYKD